MRYPQPRGGSGAIVQVPVPEVALQPAVIPSPPEPSLSVFHAATTPGPTMASQVRVISF